MLLLSSCQEQLFLVCPEETVLVDTSFILCNFSSIKVISIIIIGPLNECCQQCQFYGLPWSCVCGCGLT